MSQGLPVITTNKCLAGLELIKQEENGYIVNILDRMNLLKTTRCFFKDDRVKINKLRDNCLKSIESYTIENMASMHIEVLKNIF